MTYILFSYTRNLQCIFLCLQVCWIFQGKFICIFISIFKVHYSEYFKLTIANRFVE